LNLKWLLMAALIFGGCATMESNAHRVAVQADGLLASVQVDPTQTQAALGQLESLAAGSPTLAAVLDKVKTYVTSGNVAAARLLLGVLIAETGQ